MLPKQTAMQIINDVLASWKEFGGKRQNSWKHLVENGKLPEKIEYKSYILIDFSKVSKEAQDLLMTFQTLIPCF